MVTGTLEVEFILHDCHTLKEKRSIIKRIIERTKNRFNVSAAETDCLDFCQRGQIGIAVISNSRRHANSMLDQIIDFIEKLCLVDITAVQMDFF